MIATELTDCTTPPRPRQTMVLRLIGVATSSWHRPVQAGPRKRPGPERQLIPDEIVQAVVDMATSNPWYGYKRIAVMCRRAGHAVQNRQAYQVMKDRGLLHRRKTRRAEVYQAAKLFELLPQKPNDLWQMDVTYIHIAGFGWWYAVTVIDYYSRYLLACHLTMSYSANEVIYWALLPVEGGDVLVPAEVYAGGREIQVPRWQAWARVAQEKLQRLMEDAA